MTQPNHPVRIGIDIGGTFTDFVLVDEDTGTLTLEKTLSTPADLWQGIRTGLEKLGVDLADARLIVHGTTVGLNAFLERKVSRRFFSASRRLCVPSWVPSGKKCLLFQRSLRVSVFAMERKKWLSLP